MTSTAPATRHIVPLLLLIAFLNLVDWAMTQDALSLGLATEANPLIGALFDRSPLTALFSKLVIVSICCGLLFVFRNYRSIYYTAWAATIFLVIVISYHIVGRIIIDM